MDPELIVAAIQREREADALRIDRIRRARLQRVGDAPAAVNRPHLLQRVAQMVSRRIRAQARAREARRRTLEAGR